jgi:hypothetical protein
MAPQLVLLWTLALGGAHGAQGDPLRPGVSLVAAELEDFAFEPDGRPAQGALVVSSAGGKAVANGEGWYRLAVDLPLEATSLQVTAVGAAGRSRLASRSVGLAGGPGRIAVGPLFLAPGSSCSPSWLPAFGGRGTDAFVHALAVYDDGSGPALYAGGSFGTWGAWPRAASRDGTARAGRPWAAAWTPPSMP